MFRTTRQRTEQRQSYYKPKHTNPIDYTLLPKKIIKAIASYTAQEHHELSFQQGDFFHVIGRENDLHWYAVSNPLTNANGLVPVSYFDVVDKANRTLSVIQPALPAMNSFQEQGLTPRQHRQTFGVVLYDFDAQQADELSCKADDRIVLLAHCNDEWYVAKPIGRLGGPGLVPISFVQPFDIVANQPLASAAIPSLHEWKQQTADYIMSTISLNEPAMPPFLSSSASSPSIVTQSSDRDIKHTSLTPSFSSSTSQPALPASIVSTSSAAPAATLPVPNRSSLRPASGALTVSCSVHSYIFENDQFWFILSTTLSNGKYRILYRLYSDFYEFHIGLMKKYPRESGKENKKDRIVPFMPAPVDHVDHDITKERQGDLDTYCQKLLALPRYISESSLVQVQLFGLKQGDIGADQEPTQKMETEQVSVSESVQLAKKRASLGSKVKIKIAFKSDMYAMRVPTDCSLDELKDNIKDRIGTLGPMTYRNENQHGRLCQLESAVDMEEAIILAIQYGKLTIHVDAL
ncbi:hypothetical protein DM01DRAFT_1330668 [Hesseltinella vesiculosa]|uniref:Phox-like protein n=1 Tax=Hesseltinella vesiculosa TaxID=101127 RepID=A0A1X2GWT7_9FUNG|nr:hypothetical protein DM01DRAFT_1330668 [Hesseltinella vesiculosa]